MKYLNYLLMVVIVCCLNEGNLNTYAIQFKQHDTTANEEDEEDEDTERSHMQELIDFDNERIKDPALGYVPRERLLAAYEYAQQIAGSRAAINGINWLERGPSNVSGRTRAILIDPNDATKKTVWAGGVGGGLFKCTDITAANPQWTVVNNFFANMAISAITYNPLNTQELYFGTGEGWYNGDAIRGLGIWKSTDGGTTWNQLAATNGTNYYYVKKLIVHPITGHIYAGTRQGLFRSQNGGTTFTKVLGSGTGAASNEITDIEASANGTLFCAIDNADGVYSSATGAAGSWTKLNTVASGFPTASMGRIELAVAPSNANVLYAMVEVASALSNIYKSTDAGVNWSAVTKPVDAEPGIGNEITRGQAWYDLTCAVSPINENIVFVGGIDLFKTTNGGTSWTQLSHWYGGFGFQYVHADQHEIVFEPGSSTNVYFGNDGGIYRTTNGGTTIDFKGTNYNVTQFYACAIHPTAYVPHFLAGAQDNGSNKYSSFGINSTVEVTGGDGAFCHIDQDQSQFQYTSYVRNSYYVSTDGGNNFTGVTLANNTGAAFINVTDYDDLNNRMYCADANGIFVRWNNPSTAGNNHNSCTVTAFGTSRATAITVSPNVNNRVYFGTGNGRIVYVDNAHTGTAFAGTHINNGFGMPTNSVSCIEIEKGNENHIIVTYFSFGVNNVWETTNGGTSWTSVEGNLPDMPVRWALFNPLNAQQCLLATELGVWSTDLLNGVTTNWGPSNNGLANVRTDMMQLRSSDNLIIAATHARGLFSTDAFTNPKALFDADKQLVYNNMPVNFNDGSYKATQWNWNFGDATTSTVQYPIKTYNNPGQYNVSLFINNNAGINETKNNYIQVLPNKGTPYVAADGGDFESNPLHFGNLHVNGTPFQRGSSAVAGKNGTYSGANAWVTGLTGNYANNTTTYLYTPNYSFTAPGSYLISFYAKFAFENQYDGFNVEYSLDKGLTWQALGNVVQAGWNNFANASGNSAFPAGRAFITGTQAGFTLYQYATSALSGNSNVAFRIAVKTDNTVTAAGLVLDNFSITGPANNLPVMLTTFSGTVETNHNELHWETASELNNKGFYLEKSSDAIRFTSLAFIEGAGSSALSHTYSYIDYTIDAPLTYYRLRQVDFDDKFTYSNIILLKRTITNDIQVLNPIQHELQFTAITAGNYMVQVYNATGLLMMQEHMRLENGSTLPAQQWSKGIYLVCIENSTGERKVLKVVKS